MSSVLSGLKRMGVPAALAGMLVGCSTLMETHTSQATDRVVIRDESGFQDAITTVADSALPCVVYIEVTGTTLQQAPAPGPLGMLPNSSQGISKVPMHALGSGILINSSGHIITNNHVVENARSITVHFYDGTERSARLIGSDRYTDIAVIQVDGIGNSRTARLGNSDSLHVGQWVVAIGAPRGLDWTVTAGIVSATHRAGLGTQAPAGLQDFIQTDTAINPGNSGGPLLNLKGEVVGMNAMIISQSQGSEGLGFAIPSNIVRTVAESLIRDRKVTRGDLGISAQDLTDALRRVLFLADNIRGIEVAESLPLGPASEAGVSAGDTITTFQGSPVQSSAQFNRLVASSSPGSRVTLGLIRDGKSLEVKLTVADQVALMEQRASRPDYALLGIRVDPVSVDLAHRVGLDTPSGVVVVEVVPGSPADNADIAKGDIIFQVDGAPVNTQDDFRLNVGQAIQAGNVVVLIRDAQSGQTGFMEVPTE